MTDTESYNFYTAAPNDKYKKFFDKFTEINTIPVKDYKPVHLLAYFVKKYREQYNCDYKFKFNTPAPGTCFEIFQIKRLCLNLTSDPELLKSYIDWAFDIKIKKAKRKITSISFINDESTINYYKAHFLMVNKNHTVSDSSIIDRTRAVPESVKTLFAKVAYISTYGELAFIYNAYKANSLDASMRDQVDSIFLQMKEQGFDLISIERVK